jgi:putative ABC transport system permease protein
MRLARKIRSWLGGLVSRGKFDSDMESEMKFHLELRIEKNVASGMSAEHARYAALKEFGGMDRIKERCRDERGFEWLDQVGRDIRLAFRRLLKSPAFTVVAVLTLALGIGVNATNFSVLNTLLLKPPPFQDLEKLVFLYSTTQQDRTAQLSPAEFQDIRKGSRAFERLSAYSWGIPNFAEKGQPAVRLTDMSVTEDFFPMLRMAPARGRLFTPEEDRNGGVAIASDGFWKRQLGGDAGAVGRTLRLDGKPVILVGVMPPSMDDQFSWGRVDLWVPMAFGPETWQIRDSAWLRAMGRLKPGVSVAQARAQMQTLAERQARDFPKYNAQKGLTIVPYLAGRVDGMSRRMTWLVMDLTLFVLVIACVNLANLQLVRTTSQRREHAIRLALGSSRSRLMRLLVIESVLVSLIGGGFGLLVAHFGNIALGRHIVVDGYTGLDLSLDLRVVGFAFLAAALTGAAFGIVPAWIASQTDTSAALKQGGRSATADGSRHRLRHFLIVSEIAIALVLLAGAGFFVRGTQRMAHRDLGWRPEGLVMGSMTIPSSSYKGIEDIQSFYRRLLTSLRELPGVDKVAISAGHPALGHTLLGDFAVEGRAAPSAGSEPIAFRDGVSPGFLGTLGIRILLGRDFTDADRMGGRSVVIINKAMAAQFWPGENAIGKRIGATDPANRNWQEVIGVVNDISIPAEFVAPPTRFQMYVPIFQSGFTWISITLSSKGDARVLGDSARRAVARIDPDVAVYGLAPVTSHIEDAMANLTTVSSVLIGMAMLGLLLATVGVYGVIANLASQRTHEIGIRTALGAQQGDVIWMIMRNGLRLTLVGAATGLAFAFVLGFVLARAMPELHGQSAVVTLGVTAAIVAAALLACWFPARKATRVDPILALKLD